MRLKFTKENTAKSKMICSTLKTPTVKPTRLRIINIESDFIKRFRLLSFCLIMINSTILCIDGSYLSENTIKIINHIDFAFLLLFYLEIFLKIILNKGYFSSFLNIVDLLLFLLNIIVQIYLTAKGYNFLNKTDIKLYNFVRSLHVLRICRLLISHLWISISVLIIELIKIIKSTMDFLIILIIFLFLFTLIGRDLFKFSNLSHAPHDEEILRMNFDNFLNAFLINFLIFIDEEWHLFMFAHMKTFSKGSALYFVINLIFSTIFLNKIFLVSLISNLIESKNMKKIIEGNIGKSKSMKNLIGKIKEKVDKLKSLFKESMREIHSIRKRITSDKTVEKKSKINKNMKTMTLKENTQTFTIVHKFSIKRNTSMYKSTFEKSTLEKSFTMLTKHHYFSNFMLIMVLISLLTLAAHDPYQSESSYYNNILRNIDIPIFIIFTIELIIEIISHEKGYLTISILLKLFICFIYLFYFLYELEILKLLLIVRLFLLLNFSKELKLTFKALIKSLGDILLLFFFFILFSVLFALIGVKCFKGAFWYCDGLCEEFLEQVFTKENCLDFGGDWINYDFNFDNIFKASEMVFIVGNSEGWLPLM